MGTNIRQALSPRLLRRHQVPRRRSRHQQSTNRSFVLEKRNWDDNDDDVSDVGNSNDDNDSVAKRHTQNSQVFKNVSDVKTFRQWETWSSHKLISKQKQSKVKMLFES